MASDQETYLDALVVLQGPGDGTRSLPAKSSLQKCSEPGVSVGLRGVSGKSGTQEGQGSLGKIMWASGDSGGP